MKKIFGAMLLLSVSVGLGAAPPNADGPRKDGSKGTTHVASLTPMTMEARLKVMQNDMPGAVSAGKKAAFLCANCHGDDGNSKYPEVPNLAGQSPAFLLEQFRKFATGQRKDDFMQGLIKQLSDEERVQIALFYAEAKAKPGNSNPTQAKRGQEIYARLCAGCHGENAMGNDKVPRLSAQQQQYLVRSLIRYRDRTGERVDAQMQVATAPLSNDDISAVAAYLAGKH